MTTPACTCPDRLRLLLEGGRETEAEPCQEHPDEQPEVVRRGVDDDVTATLRGLLEPEPEQPETALERTIKGWEAGGDEIPSTPLNAPASAYPALAGMRDTDALAETIGQHLAAPDPGHPA